MNLLIDPVSATVAGWQLVGKTIEQQLRIGNAMNQAFLASLSLAPVPTAKKTAAAPDFLSKRQAKPTAPKPKSAPRKVTRSAKPVAKAEKKMAKPAAVKVTPVAKPPKQTAPKAPEAPSPKVVAAKPALAPSTATAPKASKPVKEAPRRRTRAPSKPPAMPVAPKGKLN